MGPRFALLAFLLPLVCLGAPERTVLGSAIKVGTANLETQEGAPVTVDYYNLQGSLKGVAYRLGQEYPKEKGWKHSGSDEYAVFTSSNPSGDAKWQRIAVFRGKLDARFKAIPGTEKTWLNVIVYRVRTVRVHRSP